MLVPAQDRHLSAPKCHLKPVEVQHPRQRHPKAPLQRLRTSSSKSRTKFLSFPLFPGAEESVLTTMFPTHFLSKRLKATKMLNTAQAPTYLTGLPRQWAFQGEAMEQPSPLQPLRSEGCTKQPLPFKQKVYTNQCKFFELITTDDKKHK